MIAETNIYIYIYIYIYEGRKPLLLHFSLRTGPTSVLWVSFLNEVHHVIWKKNNNYSFFYIVNCLRLTWVRVLFIIVSEKSELQSCTVCLFVIYLFHRWTLHLPILNRLILNVSDLWPFCKPYIYIILIFDEPNLHFHKTHWFFLASIF